MKKKKAVEAIELNGTNGNDGTNEEPEAAAQSVAPEEQAIAEAAPAPELPPSPFVQIGSYREQDGMMSVVSAWDLHHCGCVVRTKHILENFMTVSEVFIPDAGIRDGKVVRSMI